jgi:hypothetical protein
MTSYKSGLYRLEKSSDLFSKENDGWVMGESIEVRLTEKEAKNLFRDGLFTRLGFVGWTYLGE